MPSFTFSAADHSHMSQYAGEEKREIKSEQITLYNKLRGYSSDDPCQNVPKGHDPMMWKKHHNCQ